MSILSDIPCFGHRLSINTAQRFLDKLDRNLPLVDTLGPVTSSPNVLLQGLAVRMHHALQSVETLMSYSKVISDVNESVFLKESLGGCE